LKNLKQKLTLHVISGGYITDVLLLVYSHQPEEGILATKADASPFDPYYQT